MDRTQKHTIFINDHRYQVEDQSLTGSQIKALDSIPPGNSLFLEVPGPDPDRRIDDAENVVLRSGVRFYDLPRIQRGAQIQEELRLLESWFTNVSWESVDEGIWASVSVELPSLWEVPDPRIAVVATLGFPESKPDGFWVSAPARMPNGGELSPGRAQQQRQWAKICWQVQNWDQSRERLWRYFKAMQRWFVEGWQ